VAYSPEWPRRLGLAGLWLAGLAAFAVLLRRWPRDSWPEQLAVVGGLGTTAGAGAFFPVLAAVGLAARVGWAGRQLGRAVLR
jgi:hypothetical protein